VIVDVLTAIRARRSVKAFTGAPVARGVIEDLLVAATWAPTHRMTQPWRFGVLDQAAMVRLAEFLRATPAIAAVPDPAKGAAKLAKLLERLPGLGAMVIVTWVRDADPGVDLEEHAAASAAVQNLMLAATAAGLGSFWSTNHTLGHPEVLRFAGADPAREGFLGAIWLGQAAEQPAAPPRRPISDIARFC
jgi:nitroreductase